MANSIHLVSDSHDDERLEKLSLSVHQGNKVRYLNGQRQVITEQVIVEQPLQIRLTYFSEDKLISRVFTITMRTPGDDETLILGLLKSEGVIFSKSDVEHIALESLIDSNTAHSDDISTNNNWEVKLASHVNANFSTLERYQVTYSSCGLCGTTSLKALELKNPPKLSQKSSWLNVKYIHKWPGLMRHSQEVFRLTGGCHSAALFNEKGDLLDLKEDIGRHNAVDKLLGQLLLNTTDTEHSLLTVVISSRISFEIVQKVIMSGVSVIVAVGAASDLAILAAKRFGVTLIGFTNEQSFNVYNGEWRLKSSGMRS